MTENCATVISLVQPASVTRLPQRPDPSVLSETIPLFFIGRNREGFWVARDADGRVGGIFLRKQSALKFAKKISQPGGCATMFFSGRFELDIENKGNSLIAYLGAAKRILTRLAPRPLVRASHIEDQMHRAASENWHPTGLKH
jgi:hypothetical protein